MNLKCILIRVRSYLKVVLRSIDKTNEIFEAVDAVPPSVSSPTLLDVSGVNFPSRGGNGFAAGADTRTY